ncbi:pyrimidine reductase family protein [Lentzea sp. NBRC 105346]|uniref:pyrimidine reductase family protein n=1 Tax=Lentzea sp. NBRC 105346 TaxID=3032205 RepID=UPI002557B54E|nr:pyrimidine reductase family protein [Lentzea sp. NBRC 105346]
MLWPSPGAEITDTVLEELYAYPSDRTWVQVNFVSSVDGAVSVTGTSKGLGSPADKKIFMLGRDLCDVVLVGAGTVLVERYRGAKPNLERRERLGLAPIPPIAVVTARGTLTEDLPLFTDTVVPPIIITTKHAHVPTDADVIIAGEDEVDLKFALDALAERGLRRVDCEGGPTLFGRMAADDLVDELNLTLSPQLAVGDAGRIAHGPLPPAPRAMELRTVLHDQDVLLLRYRRRDSS